MNLKRFLPIVFVVVAACAAFFIAQQFLRVKEDFRPLDEFAKANNYAALAQRVQAKPVSSEGFSFVALGDSRTNFDIAKDVFAKAAAEKPFFFLHTGDLVRPSTVESYVSYHVALVQSIAPIPFVPVPGNHEKGPNKDFAAFRHIYGNVQFSFDYGDCRFVGIHNADRWKMTWSDLNYLEQELSKPGATYRFVLFHVPPEFLENYAGTEEGRGFSWNGGKFRSLMTRLKVDHVFVGHIHGYATEVVDGVHYSITGGAGAPLATVLSEEGNVNNYIVVHVTPQGLKREVVRLLKGEWVRSDIP